jgi:hypothetical protein
MMTRDIFMDERAMMPQARLRLGRECANATAAPRFHAAGMVARGV